MGKYFFYIIAFIGCVLVFVGGMRCERSKHTYSDIDTSFVDISETIRPSIPEPIIIRDSFTKYLPVDTQRIIDDYLLSKIYVDTIKTEHFSFILRDTVYMNSLIGREFSYNLTYPIITRAKELPKRKFSIFLMGDSRLSTSIVFTKDRLLIQGGYDFKSQTPYVGVGFKLY